MPVLGLADARQISERVVFTAPAVQAILPLMDGSRDIDQIVSQVGRGLMPDMLKQLVAQLDDAALLEGPVFEALLAKTRAAFDADTILPPAATAQFADQVVMQATQGKATEEQRAAEGPGKMRELFDAWIKQSLEKAENPSFDALPRGVVVPHIDYGRGWMNYAAIYGRMRVCDRPDRVVVLGTNHFGMGTGVVGCDKGFSTPLGECEADSALVANLRATLGSKFFEHRYDHEHEHSIELQVPWVQHIFGKGDDDRFPTVFGALVHDPAVNNGEAYDGNGVSLAAFVGAMKQAIANLPGRTLVISSADLSHCGPAFGDQQPLAAQDEPTENLRRQIVQTDMRNLEMVGKNKPQELIAAMQWSQNPTRWCSTGNLCAGLMIVEPKDVKMLNYSAAIDGQGMTFVSSAAMAMW